MISILRRFAFTALSLVVLPLSGRANPAERTLTYRSPDSTITVRFNLTDPAKSPTFNVSLDGRPLMSDSNLGLILESQNLSTALRLTRVTQRLVNQRYTLAFGKTAQVSAAYREVNFDLETETAKFQVQFRIYNDGVAVRYLLPTALLDQRVLSEQTNFVPAENPTAYAMPVEFGGAYEEKYVTAPVRQLPPTKPLALPLGLHYSNGDYVLLAEANLHDYPQSYLNSRADGSLGVVYPAVPRAVAELPWRVMIVGRSEKGVLESNLIANLNEAPTADTSWIHAGKVLFQWWNGYVTPGREFSPPESVLNTETLKRHIDFCAKYGIEFFSLDGYEFDKAWYGGKIFYEGQDVTKAAPDIDLQTVFAYAREKKVRVRVWLSTEALTDQNMEQVLSTYARWGADGIMVDFMGNDTQEGVLHAENILKLTARLHLTAAFHGFAKPTGWTRTYPHFLSEEGVLGQEYNKWPGHTSDPDHEVNIAFLRGAVGPMDTHEGSFRPVPLSRFQPKSIAPNGIGTLARQLAMYVVYENEQPMLADYPEAYEIHPAAFKFVREVPVSWSETKFLAGSVDEKFITLARRSGRDWYLGSLTGTNAKTYEISLSFLGPGRYRLESFSDTPGSGTDGEKINVSGARIVTAKSRLKIAMAPAGGNAVRLVKLH